MDTWLKDVIVQIAVFGTAVYCLVGLTRRLFEAISPSFKRTVADDRDRKPYPNAFARWWNEVILYFLSPGWGVATAMFIRNTGLFPDSFKQWQMAVVFGIAFGSISSLLYKLLTRLVGEKAGISVDSITTTAVTTDSVTTTITTTDPEPAGEKTPELDEASDGKKPEEPKAEPAKVTK